MYQSKFKFKFSTPRDKHYHLWPNVPTPEEVEKRPHFSFNLMGRGW